MRGEEPLHELNEEQGKTGDVDRNKNRYRRNSDQQYKLERRRFLHARSSDGLDAFVPGNGVHRVFIYLAPLPVACHDSYMPSPFRTPLGLLCLCLTTCSYTQP